MRPGNEQGRTIGAPEIDGRKLEHFVQQMKAMVPHYTPEWRFSPDDPDAGTALFYLAARLLGDNVKRLNQVPLNHFIAFLDLWRVSLQPARPARAHVVFSLNEGTREPVFIPAGTVLTAAADDGGEDIPFETDGALAITPARIAELFNVHPQLDRIFLRAEDYDDRLDAGDAPEVPLYAVDGDNLQEHAFYLRHDDLLLIDRPTRLTLRWHNAEKRYVENDLAAVMARSDWLEWAYYHDGKWTAFDEVEVDDRDVTLRKRTPGLAELSEVCGVTGRWIRCRIKPDPGGERSPVLDAVPAMDRVTVRLAHDAANDELGIVPTALYHNDMELDGAGFYPFGTHFLPFAVFCAASPEALSKRGSRLQVKFKARCEANSLRTGPDPEIKWKMIMRTDEFEPKPLPRVYVRQVIWEYWNGSAWMRLPESSRYESLFAEMSEQLSEYCLTFTCPDDLAPTLVNGLEDRWLRVRVLMTDPVTAAVVDYMSPWLEELRFSYAHEDTAELSLDGAYTWNNAEWADVGATVKQGGETFKPFMPIPAPAPALYLGFDAPLAKGPIRLHWMLGQRVPAEDRPPAIEWQAYVRNGLTWSWVPLKAIDETGGFTESGMLQFVGPPGHGPAVFFGRERCWLRAIDGGGAYGLAEASTPTVTAIRRNAIDVVQRRTIEEEYPERVEEGYALSSAPVIGHEVWVDETGQYTEHELAGLMERDPDRYELHRDSEGRIQRLWVRWTSVASLLGSGPDDRHYQLESASGQIRFGDGVRGRVPPDRGADKVRVTYQVTEGARGNVGAGEITQLSQALAYVNGASNPVPAAGGGAGEPIEGALQRGPQRLKHKGRGISASDVEWMVREIEPGIRKVKCIRDRNARMEKSPGSLAIVALSPGGAVSADYDAPMRRRLEAALHAALPNVISAAGKLSVVPPAFLEVSVSATVVVDSPERVMPAEAACLERLNRFLDTSSGRMDGQGWDIGEPIHASVLYGLLQAVPGVSRVDKLHLLVEKVEHGRRQEMTEERLREVAHGVVTGGVHRLQVISD